MRRRRLVRALCASMVAIAAFCGVTTRAHASAARARWRASVDQRVAGYRVYVRGARIPYGAPIDVGRPVPASDGTIAVVVQGLNLARTYHFAVSAYAADGTESALSSELALGRVNPCTVDRCDNRGSCQFTSVPDGTWCMRPGELDPCAALGVCAAGRCIENPHPAERLAATRIRVTSRGGVGHLALHGAFPATADLDPTAGGAIVELADVSGAILYRTAVAGTQFKVFRDGTAFRYLASRGAARETNGLRLLDVFRSARSIVINARAESVDLRELIGSDALRVTLRFGDTCARALDVSCHPLATGALSCR